MFNFEPSFKLQWCHDSNCDVTFYQQQPVASIPQGTRPDNTLDTICKIPKF